MARMTQKTDPAQAITDEIIALLEKGTMPWRQPWTIAGGGVPLRVGGERYKGINAFLLGLRAAMLGYSAPTWMTFNQARALDACVRKGARSSLVVYYGTAGKKAEGGDAADGSGGGDSDGAAGGTYRFLKTYRVFNVEQIEGLDAAYYPEPYGNPAAGPDPIPECQAFFEAIGADVVFGGDRACYIPSLDRILMPDLSRFESAGLFYSTWAHELGHYSKTPERLDRRFGVSSFGNEAYAKEEICVEISAYLLGQRMGFCEGHIDNHMAYLASWIKILKSDKRFVFTAAAHAQRIVDYLVEASAKGMASSAANDMSEVCDAAA